MNFEEELFQVGDRQRVAGFQQQALGQGPGFGLAAWCKSVLSQEGSHLHRAHNCRFGNVPVVAGRRFVVLQPARLREPASGLRPGYAFCHAAATHFSGIFPWWSQLQRRSTQSGMWLDREMRREVSTGVLTDSTWCRCFCAVTTIAKPSAAGLMFTRGSCPVGFCNQAQPKK